MSNLTAPLALPEKHAELMEAEADLDRLITEEKTAGELADFVAEKLDWTGLNAPDGTPLPSITKQFIGEKFAAHDAAKRELETARRRVADEKRVYGEAASETLVAAVDGVRKDVLARLAEIEPALEALATLDRDARASGLAALRCLPNTRATTAALRHLRTVIGGGNG